MGLRLGGYVRVSSEEQAEGYSVEAQKHAIIQWAATNGYHIDRFFVDVKSGRNDNRTEFRKATRWVMNNTADGLVVHKIDRFARNLMDLLAYLKQIQDADKRFFSVNEPFVNDDSPISRLFVSIAGALAQFYSDNLSTEIKKGQAQMVREGIFPGGRVPLGYYRCDSPPKICVHSQWGPFVTMAFKEFSSGNYALRGWHKEALSRGGPDSMSMQSWAQIFRNRFYLGEFKWKGKYHQGVHEPLITQEVFNMVQNILNRGNKNTRNKHFWLLSGLLWSEKENRQMHGSLVGGNFAYYVAKKHRVRADRLEEQLLTKLTTVIGQNKNLAEPYRLAVKVSKNVAEVWECLDNPQHQREFLLEVVKPLGILVSSGGRIINLQLKQGFTKI